MKTCKVQIVVNPVAASGKARKIADTYFPKIKNLFGADVMLSFTKHKNDAVEITRHAILDGASMIIVIGGDGTINEVVNGFFNDTVPLNPECELGIFPCGTGGGFAGTLHLPKSVDEQIELLTRSESSIIDLGHITFEDFEGKTAHRLFINECQTGIGSKVASLVSSKYKIFGGTLAFGITATIQALLLKPIILQIEFDNEPVREFKLIGFVAGNGTECAGGMKLTPGAKLDDHLLDVLLMHEMSIPSRLINLPKIYSGAHILSPHFTLKQCKQIKVTSHNKQTIEADGEMLGYSPFNIEILPAAIRIKTDLNNTR